MKKFITISKTCFLLLFLQIFLASCNKTEPGPETQSIYGEVQVKNVYGEEQDAAGVTVTILQTGKSATTNSEGAYRLPNVESGTYTLKYSINGYPVKYNAEVVHVKSPHTSTLANKVNLVEPSTFQVLQPEASVQTSNNEPYFVLKGSLNKAVPAGKKIRLHLFIGKDATVSESNYAQYYPYEVTGNTFELNYPHLLSLKSLHHINSGDPVYFALYCDALDGDSSEGTIERPLYTSSTTFNKSGVTIFSSVMP